MFLEKFRVKVLVIVVFVGLSFMVTGLLTANAQECKLTKLAPGVYDVPLILSQSLEPRREEFKQDFISAQRRLRKFAEKYGWVHLTDAPFIMQAEIYDSKADFDKRAYSLFPDLQGKPIPLTFSAAIEKRIFFAVSPEIYDSNFPQGREADAYIKLITHEFAHWLEVRIVNGNEDKMGPIWFFEGFAIYVANQFSAITADTPKLSEAEIWSIVAAKNRGSYPNYKAVFAHFLKGVSLQEYVKQAGEENFSTWLRTRTVGQP